MTLTFNLGTGSLLPVNVTVMFDVDGFVYRTKNAISIIYPRCSYDVFTLKKAFKKDRNRLSSLGV